MPNSVSVDKEDSFGAAYGQFSSVGARKTLRIALCGNPNTGKSTIFNQLTGLNQKVANYPGVTVETRTGKFSLPGNPAREFELTDVPGSYSLAAISPDEYIAVECLIGRGEDGRSASPDLVIVVLDASNLDRSLYLLAQISEAKLPTIVALNQIDIAESKHMRINSVKLSRLIGMPVVRTVAHRGRGIDRLKEQIARAEQIAPAQPIFEFDDEVQEFLCDHAQELSSTNGNLSRPELIRALFDRHGPAEKLFIDGYGAKKAKRLNELRQLLSQRHRGLPFAEAYPLARRMGEIAEDVTAVVSSGRDHVSVKIDKVILHRFWGPLILLGIMLIVFQSIFTWAEPIMNLIDSGTGFVASQVATLMPDGALRSLIVDGVIGGVGSVIIFLPQIMILFLFLGLLEDSGYLPRAAFIVDRLFRWCGLSGKSFVPLLSSFACAIPGIMATRTIENRKQRLLTIVVAPLMSCSARLPVYTVMIAAFVPYETYYGLFNSRGLTLVALYSLGLIVAIIVSTILSATVVKGQGESFAMELPTYKAPTVRGIWMRTSLSARAFLKRAGTIIFAITILIWAFSYYPHSNDIQAGLDSKIAEVNTQADVSVDDLSETTKSLAQISLINNRRDSALIALQHNIAGEYLRQSYLGRIGLTLEPFFKPLGWDWRITIAALASFPAREVVVATLGTIYNLGDAEDESSTSLVEKLRSSTWDSGEKIGEPVFNVAVAMSIMVFFALCCQCGATLAVIRRETGSWLWPAFTFTYMTTLAYIGAWAAYNLTMVLVS